MTGDVSEEVEEAEEAEDDEEAATARWVVLLPGDAVDDEGD